MPEKHRMRGFKRLTTLNEALSIIEQETKTIDEVEEVDLDDAINRVTAEDVYSPISIPPFNRSAVDGYAVRTKDVASASYANPIVVELIDEAFAGAPSKMEVGSYQTIYVSTGAKMPEGADAVVPVEFTRKVEPNKVMIFKSVAPGENISTEGEDIKKGDILLKKGSLIKPYDYAFLAAAQVTKIKVYRKIRVGMIVTGSELITPFDELDEGKIVDSLTYLVRGLLTHQTLEFKHFGKVPDNITEIRDKVKKAIEAVDILILSGGTSVGKVDLNTEVISGLEGAQQLFHGVAIQPGKPLGIFKIKNKKNNKYIVLLPGYAVAAYFGLIKLVRELILQLQGIRETSVEPTIRAVLTRRVSTKLGVRTFVRVKISKSNGLIYADPVHASGSGLLSTLSHADGYFEVPENMEGLEEGTEVEVKPFRVKILP